MAIVTVLAIETDIHGYRDRPGHGNRYGYRDRTGLKTDMAIVTVLAIETDNHLSGIEPSIKCKEFVRR